MTLLTASFEVAPAGTAIPTTGGVDAFNLGFTGSGASFVSDSTSAAVAEGTLAGKITIPATAVQTYRGWNWSGGVVHGRLYVYLTAYPNGNGVAVWENRNGSTPVSRCRINSDGTVGLGVGTAAATYTTGVLPLNTLCRIEFSFSHAAGTMSLDIYSGHSSTPISGGTVTATGLTFAATTVDAIRVGIISGVTSFTFRTDAWAVSDTARVGPVAQGSTVTGVTATVTTSAPAGAAVGGLPATVTGVTATVVVQGGNRPIPPTPPPSDTSWPPDPYREVIRSGSYAITYLVDASYKGVPVQGATGMQPTGGTITDTTRPGVRRVLNLELAPEPGLFDLLAPIGTTLTVTARITYLNRQYVDIPMGVFDVDSQTLSTGGGGLKLTAADKWAKVKRTRFIGPAGSTPGLLVVDQIAWLIKGALGADEPVAVSATSTAVVGALTWEKGRDKAIIDLAKSIGAWVYFDRNGLATIADVPTIGASADWLIDASPSGVLIELDRQRSRESSYNLVIVSSSSTEPGQAFNTQYVWDFDPQSPTYAGPDPANQPNLASPFGVVTYYYDTPLPLGDAGAYAAGQSILARVTGLASQVSISAAPNPAMDAFAVIDVLAPRERYDIPRVMERHVADTVTHPLTLGSPQHIEGRSTRTDEYTG